MGLCCVFWAPLLAKPCGDRSKVLVAMASARHRPAETPNQAAHPEGDQVTRCCFFEGGPDRTANEKPQRLAYRCSLPRTTWNHSICNFCVKLSFWRYQQNLKHPTAKCRDELCTPSPYVHPESLVFDAVVGLPLRLSAPRSGLYRTIAES